MAITFDAGRQYPLSARMEFAYTDVTDDTYLALVEVPVGAIVTDIRVVITTLFDSATDDKFSIGHKHGSATAVKDYYAALSADVTAVPTEIVGKTTGLVYTSPSTVGVTWNGTGTAPSAGEGVLVVSYIMENRANEVNP